MYTHLANRVYSWILAGLFLLALSVGILGHLSSTSLSMQNSPQRTLEQLSAGEHEPDFG